MFKHLWKIFAVGLIGLAPVMALGQAGTSPYPSVYIQQGGINSSEFYLCGAIQGFPLLCPTVGNVMPLGTAIASATTIAPLAGITHITGTTAIATITPPAQFTSGQITLIPDGAWSTTTAGNIAIASTAVVSKALILTYDNVLTKWFPSY